MGNLDFLIKKTVNAYDNVYRQMIGIEISLDKGKFPLRAAPQFVRVKDEAGNIIKAFIAEYTPNGKKMIGYFTTDAFSGIAGNVDIEFGYGEEVLGVFENVDINSNIAPLDSILASINAPDADNAWLQSIS